MSQVKIKTMNFHKLFLTALAAISLACPYGQSTHAETVKAHSLTQANIAEQINPVSSFPNRENSQFFNKPSKATHKNAGIPQGNTTGLPSFEGFLAYSTSMMQIGWYGLPTSSAESMTNLTALPLNVASPQMAILYDGVIYIHTYSSSFFGTNSSVYAFEEGTGNPMGSVSVWNAGLYGRSATIDPTSNEVYAIMSTYQLSKLNYTCSDNTVNCEVTPIGDLEQNFISIACDSEGQLYGIDFFGDLYKIDKTDASAEFVGSSGLSTTYSSAITIEPHSDRMFYSYFGGDYDSFLAEIDVTDGSATLIYDYPDECEIQIVGLLAKFVAEGAAPNGATDVTVDFPGTDLSGTISFTAPTALFDGTPATGAVSYKVLLNDELKTSGSTEYGKTVTENISVERSGDYKFTVIFSNEEGGDGPAVNVAQYVGIKPLNIPSNAKLTFDYDALKANVSWDAVTSLTNGEAIDTDKVTYTVTRSDGKVVAEGIKATSVEDQLVEPEEITMYYYEVSATYLTVTSNTAKTNQISLGCLSLPYSATWASGFDLSGYTIIDGFEDGKTWELGTVCMLCMQSDVRPKDEYFILPPMKLKAANVYDFSFVAEAQSGSSPETLEVLYGKAPTKEALTYEAYEPVVLGEGGKKTFSGHVSPDEDGNYYLAFHAISDRDMWYLRLYSVTIEDGKTINIPDKVENLTLATRPYEYDVTLDFDVPTHTVGGDPIASVYEIDILRDDNVVKTFENIEAGSHVTYVDIADKHGSHTYQVATKDKNGLGSVVSETVHVYGYFPMSPEWVKAKESQDYGEVEIEWSPVNTDITLKPIPAGKVTYILYDDRTGEVLADDLTENTWKGSVCEEGKQDMVRFSVAAKNDVGIGWKTSSETIMAGAPYYEYSESFADKQLSSLIAVGTVAGGGSFYLADDYTLPDVVSADDDNGYLLYAGFNINDIGEFFTGYVYVPDTDPAFSFWIFNAMDEENDIINHNFVTVGVREKGSVATRSLLAQEVNEIAGGKSGWVKKTISLDNYIGKPVQFIVDCTTTNLAYTPFDCLALEGTSSVKEVLDVTAAPMVRSEKSNIVVSNAAGADVSIASMDGKLIYVNSDAPTSLRVPVAPGVYVVRTNDKSVKLLVK